MPDQPVFLAIEAELHGDNERVVSIHRTREAADKVVEDCRYEEIELANGDENVDNVFFVSARTLQD